MRNDKDHQSHTAYVPGSKKCPSSHPVRIVKQKIESIWDLSKISGKRRLVWSHGDTTGHGYHADFVNGWDQDVLEAAMEGPSQCDIRKGRDNSNCKLPALEQSENSMEQCAANYQAFLPKGRLVQGEDCTGRIPSLCAGESDSPIAEPFNGFVHSQSLPEEQVELPQVEIPIESQDEIHTAGSKNEGYVSSGC